jgi:hypothetical protein
MSVCLSVCLFLHILYLRKYQKIFYKIWYEVPLSAWQGESSGFSGGDCLQIWRLAKNILNKQLRAAENGWSYSWSLGEWLTNPHRKRKQHVIKCYIWLRNETNLSERLRQRKNGSFSTEDSGGLL